MGNTSAEHHPEVKKVVGLQHMESKNERYRVLFEEKHEKLRREGEKWLKKTAESCMLASTLIMTLSFAAGFTPPGGNGQHTGMQPIPLRNIWLKRYAASNAISLIFSVSSVLVFLSILTSTYSMKDFVKSLPFKLLLGLFSLSTSILAILAGLVAGFFGVFKHHELQFPPYPIAVVAFVLILFVARLYLPLFYQVLQSTLTSYLQFRSNRFVVPHLDNSYW